TVNIVDEQPLKVTGFAVKDKVYDGTTTAVMEGDIYLDTSAIIPGKGSVSLVQKDVSAKFEDAESGSNKVVQIEGLSLEGADAKYYTLDLSGFTATIKKAPVMGIVFESETASFDGEAHGLEATYPENAGITAVYYTYEKDGVILTEAPKEEGVYTVKATFSVDNNHESVAPMTATLTISNGAKVEAVTITGVPDGTKGCTVTADKELVSKVGEVITYTLKRNVDKYAYVPATFSIGEKAVEMSQLNYDQATHTYTYAYTVESIDKPVTAVVNYVLLGDFSGDGDINIIDAQQVAQYAASGETLTPEQQAAGDVNFDKMINILDAQKIAQFAADSTILF
ncbi:MAG: YDG domain-containing protein, partial [Eubacterium sp.]